MVDFLLYWVSMDHALFTLPVTLFFTLLAHQGRSRPPAACVTTSLLWSVLLASGGDLPAQELSSRPASPRVVGLKVGKFPVDVRTGYTLDDGLPANEVFSIAVLPSGDVYAGTAKGLARFDGRRWMAVASLAAAVTSLEPWSNSLLATTSDRLFRIRADSVESIVELPKPARDWIAVKAVDSDRILLATRHTFFRGTPGNFIRETALDSIVGKDFHISQVAVARDGQVAVAADHGLFLLNREGVWSRPNPVHGDRSWLPRNVGGVAFDARGRLWFGSRQGVGVIDGGKWTLYAGEDGLPYNDFTCLSAGENATIWFGTTKGALRFDGKTWTYRQGRRWLPDDEIRQVAVAADGTAWFATKAGVAKIESRMMTLAEKARFFEDEIDKYHRRTPYEFVDSVGVGTPGVKSQVRQHDDDNDGLWTAMYGAGEAFAYAATKDPKAKERATKAFRALRFLSQVTQGGEHPAPRGFPARSILPASGPNPNRPDSAENDPRYHSRDPLWKAIVPRWPKSADGKWYWKCDTSSDELDGHYFCYAAYYDLVAQTDDEKRAAREVIAAVTDHLLEHDFNLVDHDGKPTRWGVFGPKSLNLDPRWAGARGLNSLAILSYLRVAQHATGDKKYAEAFQRLVSEHGYLNSLVTPKPQSGPSTGNHSDDEMAFMDYYNLLKYEHDPTARRAASQSLYRYWTFLEQPERNPLFNYIFAASFTGAASGRGVQQGVPDSCLSDALDQLKRFPLDRFNWAHSNSHRIDIVPIANGRFGRRAGPRGHLHSGQTLPVDERYFDHWNHDPWSLNTGGSGTELGDGAVFLLPYYLGLYHGFIIEEPAATAAPPG
jgi:hypothetical protein